MRALVSTRRDLQKHASISGLSLNGANEVAFLLFMQLFSPTHSYVFPFRVRIFELFQKQICCRGLFCMGGLHDCEAFTVEKPLARDLPASHTCGAGQGYGRKL